MPVNQRTYKLYCFYYCHFYISPLKENKNTSNNVPHPRSKIWNMDN